MSEYERKRFEEMLAFHSAPTLLGVKCANLFAVHQNEFSADDIEEYFGSMGALKGLSVRCLCRCKSRALVYVYQKELLEMWLLNERTAAFLEGYGYSRTLTINEKLDILEQRISCENFPHEFGVFLGYPLDDVLGFIENKGANCLFCGFWKVYSDPEGAQKTFNDYVNCRDYLCNNIKHGVDLYSAVVNFRRNDL